MTAAATIARMPLAELTGWRAGLTMIGRAPQGPELVAFKDRCAALRVTVQDVERAAREWMERNCG